MQRLSPLPEVTEHAVDKLEPESWVLEALPPTRQLSDVGLVLGEVRRQGVQIHRRGESRRRGSREGLQG